MPSNLPPITVIIPTFNEQDFICDCIRSLVYGSYPSDLIEILVIDGESTDQTKAAVECLNAGNASIRILNNDKKITPVAVNLGVAAASYDIVVWVGAHAVYDKEYLLKSVTLLIEGDWASVGGVIIPIGKTAMGKAIAAATSSIFGIGNAKYRHAKGRQIVDTVFGGCWKKSNILKVGGFDEGWVRNQDYEFNCRLREMIGPILLDPSIRCSYYCRDTISSLAKQYFNYGYWRFKTFSRHPSSFSVRQAAPLALLTGLIVSMILLLVGNKIGLIIPGLYLTASLTTSVYKSFEHQRAYFLILLPIIFVTLHLAWASGFVVGAASKIQHKIFGNS